MGVHIYSYVVWRVLSPLEEQKMRKYMYIFAWQKANIISFHHKNVKNSSDCPLMEFLNVKINPPSQPCMHDHLEVVTTSICAQSNSITNIKTGVSCGMLLAECGFPSRRQRY